MFPSDSFTLLCKTSSFRSLVHFELIFVCGAKWGPTSFSEFQSWGQGQWHSLCDIFTLGAGRLVVRGSKPGSPGLSNHTPVWVALALAFITRMAPAICLQLWPCLSALVRTSPLRVQQTPAPPVPLRQGCPARFSSHTHVSVPRAQRPSRDDFSRIQPVSLPRTLGLGWAGLGWAGGTTSHLGSQCPRPTHG